LRQLSINTYLKQILVFTLLHLFCVSNLEPARSAGGEPTAQDLNTPPISATPALIQTGSNNYANYSSNTGGLTPSYCSGTCGFAMLRTISVNDVNGNLHPQTEFLIGGVHSFNSPDLINAENNRQLVQNQKEINEFPMLPQYKKDFLDACKSKDVPAIQINARIIAKILNDDYTQILNSCK